MEISGLSPSNNSTKRRSVATIKFAELVYLNTADHVPAEGLCKPTLLY